MIAIVAALDEADLIGVGGRLPWHAPADLRHFRDLTMGHAVVMGRKTWESIGRPLRGRECIVATRRLPTTARPAVSWTTTPRIAALDRSVSRDVFIIGGASLFAIALPHLADRIYFTRIHHTFPAGADAVYFPPWEGFVCVAAKTREADAANPWPMTFERWERA